MQKVTGIGGVFFRAKDPRSLSDWYEHNLSVDITERTWAQEGGQTVFSPFGADSDYFGRSSQQSMICFRVADLQAMIAQLNDGCALGFRTCGHETTQLARDSVSVCRDVQFAYAKLPRKH